MPDIPGILHRQTKKPPCTDALELENSGEIEAPIDSTTSNVQSKLQKNAKT